MRQKKLKICIQTKEEYINNMQLENFGSDSLFKKYALKDNTYQTAHVLVLIFFNRSTAFVCFMVQYKLVIQYNN